MKSFFTFLILCFVAVGVQAQTNNSAYDKALADSLGADDYGMKQYILVILKTGPNTSTDKAQINKAFQGHMENIGKLVEQGKLIVAGPIGKNDKTYRGIFILNAKTKEEARAILATDPAVKAEFLDADLYDWYGSAALPMYLPIHNKLEKKKI
ncbi:YciI family protein [Pontibacter locisalis]|uniref:YciI family protein n=1 Tax=Pontibacter locisalis TaxID=1719035 RepID=A0ABW5IMU3_9BACT